MDNLHRELAPISDAAWSQIEEEASRTLKRNLAGRRVVDVSGPGGSALSAVGTGHLRNIETPHDGVLARQREVKPVNEFRVPFRVDRSAIDDVLRYLRIAGVNGPYSVVLSADAYTAVSETRDHGYPIHDHIKRLISGDIIWAPAIEGAFVLTTRGGDYTLQLGQDISIGYLSHDASSVELYLQETFTFLVFTSEASVALATAP
jgi:uncharacterized linocin/CFP29 family protein